MWKNCVVSISFVEWAEPTQIFMMAQSMDASISSLMSVRLVAKPVSDAELYFVIFLHDCTKFFQLEQLPN
jgi:hypothetical protein